MELGDSRLATEYCDSLYIDIVNNKYLPQECNIHADEEKIIQENKQGETDW